MSKNPDQENELFFVVNFDVVRGGHYEPAAGDGLAFFKYINVKW